MSVEIGLKGRAEETVTDANTAQAACSGALPVYGTPFMTALMEKAAWTSIAPRLRRAKHGGHCHEHHPHLRLPRRHPGLGGERGHPGGRQAHRAEGGRL